MLRSHCKFYELEHYLKGVPGERLFLPDITTGIKKWLSLWRYNYTGHCADSLSMKQNYNATKIPKDPGFLS
jgi:hypothetical protein